MAVTRTSGPGPQQEQMLHRLRARSVSSWRHGDREQIARAAAQRLADLAAEAAGEPRRAVSDAGVLALADQLAVLAADARAAGVPDAAVTEILDALATGLGLR